MANSNVREIDLHRMTVIEAKKNLGRFIQSVGPDVKEIIVIHGYHSGTALKNMIATELRSARVKTIAPSLNAGRTRLFLR